MSVPKFWPTVNVIAGIAVASWILCESLPRDMLGGKNLDSSVFALCFSGLAFAIIHWRLSNKHWLAELFAFIFASPIAITLAYLVDDFARLTGSLKSLPDSGMFLFSPFTIMAAVYGGIAGVVTILLERIMKRLRHQQSTAPQN
jgi:ABC-type Co2+ transport system permease subunit